jgi:hypothetical protein
MYCLPKPDETGEIRENPESGGRRRIDRILYDPLIRSKPIKSVETCSKQIKSDEVQPKPIKSVEIRPKPIGFQFLTSLAGLTDHVPIAMSIETNLS